MSGNQLAKLLRKIADAVEGLGEAELDDFVSTWRPIVIDDRVAKKRPIKNRHSKVDTAELEAVLEQLAQSDDRAAGFELLDSRDLSRKELERLARLRSIHVTKDDNVERIREKIVEVMIGSRLSSRAIRGSEP